MSQLCKSMDSWVVEEAWKSMDWARCVPVGPNPDSHTFGIVHYTVSRDIPRRVPPRRFIDRLDLLCKLEKHNDVDVLAQQLVPTHSSQEPMATHIETDTKIDTGTSTSTNVGERMNERIHVDLESGCGWACGWTGHTHWQGDGLVDDSQNVSSALKLIGELDIESVVVRDFLGNLSRLWAHPRHFGRKVWNQNPCKLPVFGQAVVEPQKILVLPQNFKRWLFVPRQCRGALNAVDHFGIVREKFGDFTLEFAVVHSRSGPFLD